MMSLYSFKGCAIDTDCTVGRVCKDGKCVKPGTGPGGTCNKDTDCRPIEKLVCQKTSSAKECVPPKKRNIIQYIRRIYSLSN